MNMNSKERKLVLLFPNLKPGQVFVVNQHYAGVPRESVFFFIEDLKRIRTYAARHGINIRVCYRGPRPEWAWLNTGKFKSRGVFNRRSTCLKSEAKFFTVY